MMVGNNLKDAQLQQIVDKTIILADQDGDGKISFDEFANVSISSLSPDMAYTIVVFTISDNLLTGRRSPRCT